VLRLWLAFVTAVVLESEPGDASLLAWAVRGCNEALVAERCATAESGEAPRYRARLTWRDALHAHVTIVPADVPDAPPVLARDVTFQPADAPGERYRALGLIVASYVLTQDAQAPAAPTPPRTARAAGRLDLDAALLGGPALDEGPLRAGGSLRLHLRAGQRLPWLGVVVGASASHRAGTPRLTWAALTLGASARAPLATRWALEGRLEGVGQRLFARAHDPERDRRERASRTRVGGQAGLVLLYQLTPGLSLFGGAELARLRPRVRIWVGPTPLGRERALEATALVGLRLTR